MVVGSFKKIFDSQRIEFIPQVQWVVGPGVTGFRPEVEPVSTNLFGGSQGGISSTSTVVESF